MRDHTPKLRPSETLVFRSLPQPMQAFLENYHEEFVTHWTRTGWEPSPENANEVHPGIFVGCHDAVRTPDFCERNNIGVILNMAYEIDYEPWDGVFLAKVGIDDGVVAPVGAFEKAALEIHLARKQDKRIIIHCAAGISRSATAALTYLMLYEAMGFYDILDQMRKARPQINPHPHLIRSLLRDLGPKFKKR